MIGREKFLDPLSRLVEIANNPDGTIHDMCNYFREKEEKVINNIQNDETKHNNSRNEM